MTEIEGLLRALRGEEVELIVVGGVAATIYGSARLTQDLDVVYRRTPGNLARLAAALEPHAPYLRGAPPGLPFLWDARTLRSGLNFTLTTALGAIDLLGEIAGGGAYEDLLPYSRPVSAFGVEFLCLGLRRLIQVKRAAGRPKDLEAISELEALLAEREALTPGDPG
jgi:hypothetical protein